MNGKGAAVSGGGRRRAGSHGGRRWGSALALAVSAVILSACGGGSGGGSGGSSGGAGDPTVDGSCTTYSARVFQWLEFRESYLWAALRPDVDPMPDRSIDAYFRASLYAGGGAIPADRYSSYQSTEAYNRFYGDGNTLGYGVAVAGQEVRGRPAEPLWIRDVNPGSAAALAGLRRGDRVVALNGRSASDVIAADDFSALNSDAAGQTLRLSFERGGQTQEVVLQSSIHPVTPVRHSRVITLPDQRRVGVLRYQSMISLADAQVADVFAGFRDQGVSAVILDLRYNGGGSVAVGQRLASHMAGTGANGQLYAELRYNAQLSNRNSSYRFSHTLGWAGVKRVYVLAGSRTCSASEQVISGLQGVGVEVVTVGSTTCGKPVGFSPSSYCGLTYSIVNFESVNARGVGAYYNGFPATCPVAENFRLAMEDPAEPLTAAALAHLQGRGCPTASGPDRQVQSAAIGGEFAPSTPGGRRPAPLRDGPELPGVMIP